MANKKLISFKDPRCATAGIFFFRKALALLFFFISFLSFSQAKMEFTESKKTFGTVRQGEVVKLEYEFINSGDQPLVITEFQVECSCTEVVIPVQPVLPGQKNKITVSFNTKTTWDRQDRVVKLLSNAKNSPSKIRFKGNVIIPK